MSKEGADLGQDRQVELWKVKKLIKSLQQARGLVLVNECRLVLDLNNFSSYHEIFPYN